MYNSPDLAIRAEMDYRVDRIRRSWRPVRRSARARRDGTAPAYERVLPGELR